MHSIQGTFTYQVWRDMKRYRLYALFVVSALGIILSTWIAAAQTTDPASNIAYHPETGQVTFVSADAASAAPLPLPGGAIVPSAQAAQNILNTYAPMFGISNPAQDLQLKYEIQPDTNTITRRYQQTYNGVPVFGGEVIVNMTASGSLKSMNGEASPNLNISTNPQITDATAQQAALRVIAKRYGLSVSDLTVSQPSLWIYDAQLLKPSNAPVVLVWRMEVTPVQALPLRELVLIDASNGGLALNFNQVHGANGFATPAEMQAMNAVLKVEAQAAQPDVQQPDLNARVGGFPDLATYTANNTAILPGTLLCDETKQSCTNGANPDADGAHKFAREAYNLFWTHHGRDSINGAGMQIRSTVKYNGPGCNAFWSGAQMVYHSSCFLAVDDVVGHELAHGITQYTSGLFYYYQSGAINESMSDVWGEALDLLNSSGNDAANVRWHLAEDSSGGGWGAALRYMDHPPEDGVSPDRMHSSMYWDSAGDQGGVHVNSGINNKAVYLMVDGGSFNGRTVTGIGYPKVLQIYYRVQTTLLVSGSDYADLYRALNQACNSLVGTAGITANDCVQVKTAAEAVEMHLLPTGDHMPEAQVCPTGQTPTHLFFDNRETNADNYTTKALTGGNVWQATDTGYAHSGLYMIYGEDVEPISDSAIEMKTSVALPAGAYLHFDHAFKFEEVYDGGVVEFSTNNGSSWSDASALLDQGQDYTHTLSSFYGNPLGDRDAFSGESHGYVSSRYNLSSLAGQSVRFRWRIGTDNGNSVLYLFGWVIDDVKIYTCTSQPPTQTPPTDTPSTPVPGAELLTNGGFEIAGADNKTAASWSAKKLTSDDKRKCNKPEKNKFFARSGSCAFQLKGTAGVNSSIVQKITPVGAAGDTFTLSAWVNAKKLNNGGRLKLVVKYGNGTKGTINIDVPTGTYAYTRVANNLVLTGTPQKLKLKIQTASKGKYIIDDVSLIRSTGGALAGTEALPLGLDQ